MAPQDLIYVGTSGRVAALSKESGETVWQIKLPGVFMSGQFVTLVSDDHRLYAHANGKLYCLEALTGILLWSNDLPRLGYELATICVAGQPSAPAPAAHAKQVNDQNSSAPVVTN